MTSAYTDREIFLRRIYFIGVIFCNTEHGIQLTDPGVQWAMYCYKSQGPPTLYKTETTRRSTVYAAKTGPVTYERICGTQNA